MSMRLASVGHTHHESGVDVPPSTVTSVGSHGMVTAGTIVRSPVHPAPRHRLALSAPPLGHSLAYGAACWLPVGSARHAGERLCLEALHARVLLGDGRAVEEVCRLLLASGQRIVHARRPAADPSTIEDAVLDAITDYLLHPQRFDPQRSSLLSWIALAATRDVDDQCQHEHARSAAEAVVAPEAVSSLTSRPGLGIKPVLLRAAPTRRERKFLIAWLRGRSFEELVRILSISGQPLESQIQQVRHLQERLRLRMKRMAGTTHSRRRAPTGGRHRP